MKKYKPSFYDVLEIMREMMCKLLKKFFLTRHSCENIKSNSKSVKQWTQTVNQKGLIRFVLHTEL